MYDSNVGRSLKALCEDGKVRRALVTAEPDTYFSQPARVHAGGTTVSGYISGADESDNAPIGVGHVFRAYLYRKNAHLLEVK